MKRNPVGRLYLVVDAGIPEDILLPRVQQALVGGVDMIQVWGRTEERLASVAEKVLQLARRHEAPCLIADNIQVCKSIGADGVHFDGYPTPPMTPGQARQTLGQGAIIGLTCGNSLEKLNWAEEHGADYVSFCSMFPTTSVDTCEIVPLEMIRTAKSAVTMPVFASGGITLGNVDRVLKAGADGIAVISAILKASDPETAARMFKRRIVDFVSADTSRM